MLSAVNTNTGRKRNGYEVKDPSAYLAPPLAVCPALSILVFLRLSFLIYKQAIIKACWNVVKIMLNNICESANHST